MKPTNHFNQSPIATSSTHFKTGSAMRNSRVVASDAYQGIRAMAGERSDVREKSIAQRITRLRQQTNQPLLATSVDE
ncbi:MAG: hypothetical protein CMO80_11875 [Verrucomicrobiales bacterium]|nr:hypothetical protein [Verrucomicrobiales bacterium]